MRSDAGRRLLRSRAFRSADLARRHVTSAARAARDPALFTSVQSCCLFLGTVKSGGSLIGAMLDGAGGYAAYSLMPPGSDVLTAEYKINFVAAAKGDKLIARGRVIRPGSRLTVASAEGFCRRGGAEHLCAVLLQTLIPLPLAAEAPL